TVEQIHDYFKNTVSKTDYYLIIFTGHGNYVEASGPRCYLLNGEWFSHSELEKWVSGVPTLFLTDSCQGIERLNEGGQLRQRSFSSTIDSTRRTLARAKYDEALRRMPLGMFVVGSSVSPGEYAYENPKIGGFYFISLISEADKIRHNRLMAAGVYGIGYIHALATKEVEKLSGERQTPYLTGYNRTVQPPFMVKL
ncbi:MAG: caspase family protein, partial [Muribaculaceae bacterium]|nr:caspase family protein [Muribaculaceae bacterium]